MVIMGRKSRKHRVMIIHVQKINLIKMKREKRSEGKIIIQMKKKQIYILIMDLRWKRGGII